MSITVRFACGHEQTLGDGGEHVPVCICGERRVQRTTAPAPRFRGACQGPQAIYESVSGVVIATAPSGPLALKE